MLYNLVDSPPPPGSLLESLFLIVTKRRQEAEFLKTRVLIEAIREPHLENSNIGQAFKDYSNVVFPFIEGEAQSAEADAKKALHQWTDKVAFRVCPLWDAQKQRSMSSRLRKGTERIKKAEDLRRTYHHKRLQ